MKQNILSFIRVCTAAALCIFGVSMCAKAELQLQAPSTQTFKLSINTAATEVKTAIEPSGIEGKYTASWKYGDKMQIYIDEVSSSSGSKYCLTNQTSGTTATFSGAVGTTEGSKTVYGFYPAGALDYESENYAVSVDVPYIQNPDLTSFDPACDILAAKPMEVTFVKGENASINNARFARELAILKIVPVDKTADGLLCEDKVLRVKMTASVGTTLTGKARLNLNSAEITSWTTKYNHVSAGYSGSQDFLINGANASYLMVAPGTLSSAGSLKFEIITDSHLISRDVVLSQDINLTAGKVTTLKVNLSDDNVQTNGDALPLNEDFSSITTGNSTSTGGSGTQWAGNSNFPTVIKAYQAGGAVKLGTGSSSGSITTKALNLSSAFTVSLKVKGWSTVEGDVVVTAGSQSKTVSYKAIINPDSPDTFETVSVPFYGESPICEVTIATTEKRCFIDDVNITSGKALQHEIICDDQLTIPCVAGLSSSFKVTSDYSWTATASSGAEFSFTPSTGSKEKTIVTVTATEPNTSTTSRTVGTITISDGTASKVVAVVQAGKADPTAKGWAELPMETVGDKQELCKHSTLPSNGSLRNYSFLFDKDKHCSLWVAWPLHSCYMGSADRTNDFDYDPDFIDNFYEANIGSYAYYPKDGTSYSHARGHQMPSAERTLTEADNSTTFYATNMTPQLQDFNGGVWETLESMERNTYICSDTLYIVAGAYFDSTSPSYAYDNKGKGKACQVPTHYWKIFLRTKDGNTGKKVSDCSADELQCVGFWFEHKGRSGSPKASDLKSVSEIETLTGFTFFPNVTNAPKSSFEASDWGL